MRKIRLLLVAVATMTLFASARATTLTPDYSINENFDGTMSSNWGFVPSSSTITGLQTTDATLSTSNVYKLTCGNASFTATKSITARPTTVGGSDSIVYVEFKWFNSLQVSNATSAGYLKFMNGAKQILTIITGTYDGSTNTTIRLLNFNPTLEETPYSVTKIGADSYTNSTSGTVASFFPRNCYMRVKARLNFNKQRVDTITFVRLTTGGVDAPSTGKYVGVNIPFIDNTATQVDAIALRQMRSSTSAWAPIFEDFKIYSMKPSAGTADVTVNYLDQDGNIAKTAKTVPSQEIGSTYTVLTTDKASFNDGTNYYAYDATNTTADNVVVASGGSAINLKFKKTALTAGTYTWTNTSSANWNETEANFTTDGSNSLSYQNSNAVSFPATAIQKNVSLTGALDLGSNNVNIDGDGYTLAGSGSLSGTGTLNLNLNTGEIASLNLTNNLTGGVAVNGGIAVILKDAAASKLTVANGATLNLSTGAVFSKAITGATGSLNILPTSNVTYTSAITGIDALNYALPSAGSVTPAGAFSSMPILNNTYSGAINVGTSLSSAMFGSTINFTSNKIALGDNVSMVYTTNPATDGSTTISIGELTGTAASKVQGARLRTLTYSIGGLNTDAVFAGTFENFAADAWTNIPVLNITKAGTGSLTLTGNSSTYLSGTTTVSAGKLIVNGSLGTTAVVATVGANGTLSGTGTISGATTVNGTLEGSLSFGNTLTLAGKTNMVVNGFNTGEYNVINVTNAATTGGTLNVTVNASVTPEVGTAIKLINAGSYAGGFTTVNVPTGYAYTEATGTLTYNGTGVPTAIQNGKAGSVSIYPTLTKGRVNVTNAKAATIEVSNVTGVTVQSVKSTDDNTSLQLSALSNGAYIVKVRLADGSVKVQKVILQK